MRVGVLALQGAFIEHEQMLQHIGVEAFEIRQLKDFQQPIDRLIIPGGESTTLRKLLKDTGLFTPIRERILDGMPVFGTCAGMILLALHIENETDTGLATMDITVRRNAYGRQLGSFYTESEFKGIDHPIPMTFMSRSWSTVRSLSTSVSRLHVRVSTAVLPSMPSVVL